MIIRIWHCGAPDHEERCTPEKPGHLPSPNAKRRQNSHFCGSVEVGIRCDGEGCPKEIEFKDHHRDMIRAASTEGWFFRQDGTMHLCFEHLTPGVIAWRDWQNPGWRGRLKRGLAGKLPSPEETKRVARTRQLGYTDSSRPVKPTRGGGDAEQD